jgi:hypothetical protein
MASTSSTCTPIYFILYWIFNQHAHGSWEYPARQGIGCNIVSSDDSANFLSFLQMLRSQDGAESLILSAAVGLSPFVGPDDSPLSDVAEFAKVLDTIGPSPSSFLTHSAPTPRQRS